MVTIERNSEAIPLPFRAGPMLNEKAFGSIRRRAMLDCCKWDSQIGDVCTLAPFPLIMEANAWSELASWAEQLTAEALAAEQELLQRTDLLRQLGLPRAIEKLFETKGRPTPAAARVMRYDFHFTTAGWRISEVNSDVPGGFTEASSFTGMMAEHFPGLAIAGDPIADWCNAIATVAGENGVVAMLSAAGFMEDHQIVSYLAKHLQGRNCRVHLAGPEHIEWQDGVASLKSAWHCGKLDAVVRFYQGEWLSKLPRRSGWLHFFSDGRTPVGNPGIAILSETKRFPLIWQQLKSPMPTWRALLPETCDPRAVDWEHDASWLTKSAFCNTGDTVSIRSELDLKKWKQIVKEVRKRPEEWIAQKRFDPVWFESPMGPIQACIGVYTINGVRAGAYVRITNRALIDYVAIDAALLVENDK